MLDKSTENQIHPTRSSGSKSQPAVRSDDGWPLTVNGRFPSECRLGPAVTVTREGAWYRSAGLLLRRNLSATGSGPWRPPPVVFRLALACRRDPGEFSVISSARGGKQLASLSGSTHALLMNRFSGTVAVHGVVDATPLASSSRSSASSSRLRSSCSALPTHPEIAGPLPDSLRDCDRPGDGPRPDRFPVKQRRRFGHIVGTQCRWTMRACSRAPGAIGSEIRQ